MSETVAKTLDTRGLACPMSTIRLGQAIRKVNVGDVIELWTDDPASEPSLAVWTRNTGHELVATTEDHGVHKHQFRRVH